MDKELKCKDCKPFESSLSRDGKKVGFTEEQIDWLCEHFAFSEEDY